MAKHIKRGDVYYAELSPVVGSEQGGLRPVLIIQNDIGNRYSPTVIVAAITTRIQKPKMPTHIAFEPQGKIDYPSVILLEQIRTIDKTRLKDLVAELSDEKMQEVNQALSISIGLESPSFSKKVKVK
ncbi:type II toxin-antitoxin system PemK/MazF family toxin [Holzapfeliella sp. He02]|uniref:mRNA interferase n=1 Tax=Holzapfeliella saturejae TaxID=3082953 RepID=A0ABU8SFA6_9LACO